MKKIIIIGVLASLMMLFVGCDDKLDVQQVYEFSLSTMPIQKIIKLGETVEIRCKLNRDGKYIEAQYFMSYFQSSGTGILQNIDGLTFLSNDFYIIDSETFRLFYTSNCQEQQVIYMTIRDNFNQVYKLSFSFMNENISNRAPLIN